LYWWGRLGGGNPKGGTKAGAGWHARCWPVGPLSTDAGVAKRRRGAWPAYASGVTKPSGVERKQARKNLRNITGNAANEIKRSLGLK